jgi:hypothetical protein
MKNLIPGTYNTGVKTKRVNLYARRFDSFEYEFYYKYKDSYSEVITADLDVNTLVQAQIKDSDRYNAKVLKQLPATFDINTDKIKLFFEAGDNDLIEGKYRYDVEIFFNNKNLTILSGYFIVLPQITDWKKPNEIDEELSLGYSYEYDFIFPAVLYNNEFNTEVSFDLVDVIKTDGFIKSDYLFDLLQYLVLPISAEIKNNISYEFIPVIMHQITQMNSQADYLRDIGGEVSSSITSSVEYSIF